MRLSLTGAGLLDPRRLQRWAPEARLRVRKAVEAGMREGGREIAQALQAAMRAAFVVRKAGFAKSMRARVLAGRTDRFPALLVGSRIPWLGIHVRGGAIARRMLIPLLPEHQRLGRRAFKKIVDALIRSGNAFFIQKHGRTILMAENIRENARPLRQFARAERSRTGVRSLKKGSEIPIAVLVRSVSLRRRFDLPALVSAQLPALAARIRKHLDAAGL